MVRAYRQIHTLKRKIKTAYKGKEVNMKTTWMTNYAIVNTEAEAIAFCNRENSKGSYYKRKNHKAHYTTWNSNDGYHGFIVWYVSTSGICKAKPIRKTCY